MKKKERAFFELYNDSRYYDKAFGAKTYHNEVLTYLVVYLKDNKEYEKYGSIEMPLRTFTEDGNIQLDFSKSEWLLNNFDEYKNNRYGNFYFKDHNSYLEVLSRARSVMYSPEMVEEMENLTKKHRGGEKVLREETFFELYDLVRDSKSDNKTKMEGIKLLGNYLGIETLSWLCILRCSTIWSIRFC